MLVIISVASLSSGHLEILVQRPQHHANAARIYQSFEQVKATLLNFGIAEKALDEVLKLLPQLGNGERLKLTPVDVPRWWGGWVVSTSTFLSIRNGDPACNTALNVHSSEGEGCHAGSEQKPLTMGVRTVCSALLPANGGEQNGRRKARALDAALRGS